VKRIIDLYGLKTQNCLLKKNESTKDIIIDNEDALSKLIQPNITTKQVIFDYIICHILNGKQFKY